MTHIYFVRHSIPDLSIKDESRPLSEEGIKKANELIKIFENIHIDDMFSSPYKRAIQTIEPISVKKKIKIKLIENFRERKISDEWIDNFRDYSEKQWTDFHYKLENGESLYEVQLRNILALEKILIEKNGRTIIIGTHGTALSTIINYYDNSFQYKEFMGIVNIMPYIVKMEFENNEYSKRTDNILK